MSVVKGRKVEERGRLRDRPFWKKEEKLQEGRRETEKEPEEGQEIGRCSKE